jgi:hypothetical protein
MASMTEPTTPAPSVLGQAEEDDRATVRGEDDNPETLAGQPIPDALDTFGDV